MRQTAPARWYAAWLLAGSVIAAGCAAPYTVRTVGKGKTALEWLGPQTYNHGTGLLSDVNTYTTTSSGVGQGPAVSHPLGGDPPIDIGYWWLFRVSGGGDKCNATNTYGNLARDAAPGLP